MVATLTESSVIDCREDDGALRDFLRANNRFLHWEEICAELIDNSLEHSGIFQARQKRSDWPVKRQQHIWRWLIRLRMLRLIA